MAAAMHKLPDLHIAILSCSKVLAGNVGDSEFKSYNILGNLPQYGAQLSALCSITKASLMWWTDSDVPPHLPFVLRPVDVVALPLLSATPRTVFDVHQSIAIAEDEWMYQLIELEKHQQSLAPFVSAFEAFTRHDFQTALSQWQTYINQNKLQTKKASNNHSQRITTTEDPVLNRLLQIANNHLQKDTVQDETSQVSSLTHNCAVNPQKGALVVQEPPKPYHRPVLSAPWPVWQAEITVGTSSLCASTAITCLE
eukprot:TRINITY_DN94824_c0_g1_i1.p1 TRINITY_DN94824_c0_g1~~TRINITY_DN94824_c0_g1_i1.p1  ORF type:complete len:263 (+),score=32.00 TRINITY_DN94824_c0_g1_i1:29-790(+)